MTDDKLNTKINQLRNKTEEAGYNEVYKTEKSRCDINNRSYTDYDTEVESTDIRTAFLDNNRGEITEAKHHIIQVLSRITSTQMSGREKLPKINKVALQTLLTIEPL